MPSSSPSGCSQIMTEIYSRWEELDASEKSDLDVGAIGLQAGNSEIERRIEDAIFLFALRLLQGTEPCRLKDVWLRYAPHWRTRIPKGAMDHLKGVVTQMLTRPETGENECPRQMTMQSVGESAPTRTAS